MNCPLCQDTALDPTFHRGIEVDICPRCKGMWLDRGELDRLVADDRPVADDHRPAPSSTPAGTPKKSKSKQKSKAKRLADLFEEVLDF